MKKMTNKTFLVGRRKKEKLARMQKDEGDKGANGSKPLETSDKEQ